MARSGPLVEVLGGVASVALLVLGAREYAEGRRFADGARPLDVEITEVMLGPDQRSFHYGVKANDQGRELKLTLQGAESGRGAPRPANKVGDRTRVLYKPSAHPPARWEKHATGFATGYFVLGGALPVILLISRALERWGQERHRRAVVAAQAARAARTRARPR